MEETVSVLPDPVALALAQSKAAGEEFVPTELLATVNTDPNPPSTLSDMDRGNAYFAPVQRDFGFLNVCHVTKKPPSIEEQERLDALMRWLRREFRDWNSATDKNCHTLAAMFVITAHCSQHSDFWPAFSASSSVNPEIVAELSKRIACLQFTPGPGDRSRTPISDKRILDRFNAADRAGDWETVASEWPRFGDHLFPDAFLLQSVCYLHVFAWDALRVSTEQLKQTAPVMFVLSSLSVADCLVLAVASTNPYLRFGSILRLFQQQRRRNESISQAEDRLLTQLLQSTAADNVQWLQWMRALNRYPMRYPQIQKSLGQALAQAPEAALEFYISSIQLTTMGIMGRGIVAECLRAFRSVASLDRRKMLWNLAHERWSQWRFGKDESTDPLMRVGCCELDYAIAGYAVECMTVQQRDDKCAAAVAELSSINELWYASETEFIQSVAGILSSFQPYAFARQIGANDDWLITEGRYILPFDPQTERYTAMLYLIRYVIPGLNAKTA
jgi:hypothetical protein